MLLKQHLHLLCTTTVSRNIMIILVNYKYNFVFYIPGHGGIYLYIYTTDDSRLRVQQYLIRSGTAPRATVKARGDGSCVDRHQTACCSCLRIHICSLSSRCRKSTGKFRSCGCSLLARVLGGCIWYAFLRFFFSLRFYVALFLFPTITINVK